MRAIIAALTTGLLLGVVAGPPNTYADERHHDSDWRQAECRYQSLERPIWTPREEYLTTVCASRKTGVSLGTLISIAQCESGWNRFANNGGNYLGLFQHAASSYVSRIRSFEPPTWEKGLSERWTNSRGQIVMSARMMAAVGTSPWSCA